MTNAQVEALAALDVFGRVARQLLAFAQEYGEATPDGIIRIPLRLTQSDLASLVGASRVRVNQVLMTFRRQGHLSVDGDSRITVHNVAALVHRCE